MQSLQKSSEDVPHAIQRRDPDDATVRATLDTVLQSQPFRTSKQCQNLLSYIVDHSLHNDDGSLRERVLGVEVFGRSPDYDTSEDPVVRIRAADVRKRLAQFYQSHAHDPAIVHFELKPGSYRATFHYEHEPKGDHAVEIIPEVLAQSLDLGRETSLRSTLEPVTLELKEVKHTSRSRGLRIGVVSLSVLLATLLSVLGWRAWAAHRITPQQRFWAPLTRPNQPVLLYLGANVAYRFSADYMANYQKEHGIKHNGPEFFIDLPKGGVIQADDLLPIKDTFVSVADLAAATQVASLMHNWSKPFNLRSAADLSIGDIRNTPCILIGGFNNTWTLETTNDLTFSFRDGTRIENRNNPGQSWTISTTYQGITIEDFALISRVLHSNTGGPVLSVGGIGQFGTQAAAEFVTSPEKMNDLLKSAPLGWENKNMQAVLRIKVVEYAPVAVDVVATSYW